MAAVPGRALRTHPGIIEAALEAARAYNFKRYQYQGIGRYERDEVYVRGIADLRVLADLVPASGFLFGAKPSSCDAAIYGFIANIYFYEIDTPLKEFLLSWPNPAYPVRCQSRSRVSPVAAVEFFIRGG